MKKRSSSTRNVLYALLAFLVIVPYLGLFGVKMWYNHKIDKIANARFIIVDKETLSLKLFDYSGNEINTYGISCGKNPGNKGRIGDLKTPEGIFHITEIEEASTWGHDFKDGKGKIEGAYGPWFLRLEVPGHKGIGLNGGLAPTYSLTHGQNQGGSYEGDKINLTKRRCNPHRCRGRAFNV